MKQFYFILYPHNEVGTLILPTLEMKKLKHKWLTYISEASRAGFKSQYVRFKNSVFFPIGVVS